MADWREKMSEMLEQMREEKREREKKAEAEAREKARIEAEAVCERGAELLKLHGIEVDRNEVEFVQRISDRYVFSSACWAGNYKFILTLLPGSGRFVDVCLLKQSDEGWIGGVKETTLRGEVGLDTVVRLAEMLEEADLLETEFRRERAKEKEEKAKAAEAQARQDSEAQEMSDREAEMAEWNEDPSERVEPPSGAIWRGEEPDLYGLQRHLRSLAELFGAINQMYTFPQGKQALVTGAVQLLHDLTKWSERLLPELDLPF